MNLHDHCSNKLHNEQKNYFFNSKTIYVFCQDNCVYFQSCVSISCHHHNIQMVLTYFIDLLIALHALTVFCKKSKKKIEKLTCSLNKSWGSLSIKMDWVLKCLKLILNSHLFNMERERRLESNYEYWQTLTIVIVFYYNCSIMGGVLENKSYQKKFPFLDFYLHHACRGKIVKKFTYINSHLTYKGHYKMFTYSIQ